MQKKMCARKKKEKSIPATPIAKGDELPPGIIRDDGPGNPPLPLLLPTSKSGMVGENSPKSVTGGDGDGAGRRKNGESIGGPVPPPPPPPPLRRSGDVGEGRRGEDGEASPERGGEAADAMAGDEMKP